MFKFSFAGTLFALLLLSFSFNTIHAMQQCLVCWDDVAQLERLDCGHGACADCHRDVIRGANGGFMRNMICSANQCNHRYTQEEIARLAPDFIERTARLQAEEDARLDPANRVVTPSYWQWMNSQEMVSNNGSSRIRRDGREVCRARMCPNCNRIAERDNGQCNHMRCPCGTQYCYRCLADWNEHGAQDPAYGHDGYFDCRARIQQEHFPRIVDVLPNGVVLPEFVPVNVDSELRNAIIMATVATLAIVVFTQWKKIKHGAQRFKNYLFGKKADKKKANNGIKSHKKVVVVK